MSHVDEGTLHAYLDGELAAAERKAVETHVAQCADCRARLAEERALIARASQLLGLAQPRERPVPSFEQVGQRRRRSARKVRLPVAWAASIALAVGLGYYLHAPEVEVVMAPTPPAAIRTSPAEPERRAARQPVTRAPAPEPGAAPQTPLADKTNVAAVERERVDTPPPATGSVVLRVDDVGARVSRAPAAAAAPSNVAPRIEEGKDEWPFASRDVARQMLGTVPVGVPGLPVRAIRRNPAGDGSLVVEQELDATTVIRLFQSRAQQLQRQQDTRQPADRASVARPGNERLARFVGGLRVEIAGPLPPDSLNRLLEQVQPLP